MDLNFDTLYQREYDSINMCTLEILNIQVMDSRLAHLFTCIVSGSTGSGKSVFTRKLIEHAQEIINPPPE